MAEAETTSSGNKALRLHFAIPEKVTVKTLTPKTCFEPTDIN